MDRLSWTQGSQMCIWKGMEGARTESAPEQETGKRSPDAALSGVRVQLEKKEYIALRMAAGYWKTCHKDAVRREAELKSENEQLRARLRDLEQRLFGRRSERGAARKGRGSQAGSRPRGHQRGRPGHGRSRLAGLEVREETADLSEDQRACPRCGRLAVPFAGSEDVEIAEIETQLWRRLIRRKRYHAACGCGALPGIVTAPSPARLIPRGKLGISVWVKVILDKYLYLRPSNRLLQELACHGLKLSPGTVAGGLQRLLPLFEPVREALPAAERGALAGGRDGLAGLRAGGGQGRLGLASVGVPVFVRSRVHALAQPIGPSARGPFRRGARRHSGVRPLWGLQEAGRAMGGAAAGLLLGPRAARLPGSGPSLARAGGMGLGLGGAHRHAL